MRRRLVFLLAALPAVLSAQQPAGQAPAGAPPARPAAPYRPFAELTKDAVVAYDKAYPAK